MINDELLSTNRPMDDRLRGSVMNHQRDKTKATTATIRDAYVTIDDSKNLPSRPFALVWIIGVFASGVAAGLAIQRSASAFTIGLVKATIIAIIVSLCSVVIWYVLACWRVVRKREAYITNKAEGATH
jgi:hypothetical protein